MGNKHSFCVHPSGGSENWQTNLYSVHLLVSQFVPLKPGLHVHL